MNQTNTTPLRAEWHTDGTIRVTLPVEHVREFCRRFPEAEGDGGTWTMPQDRGDRLRKWMEALHATITATKKDT